MIQDSFFVVNLAETDLRGFRECHATYLIPMQFLGPFPKVINARGWRVALLSGENLERRGGHNLS